MMVRPWARGPPGKCDHLLKENLMLTRSGEGGSQEQSVSVVRSRRRTEHNETKYKLAFEDELTSYPELRGAESVGLGAQLRRFLRSVYDRKSERERL